MVSNASAVMLEPEAISERATDILRNVFHHFAFRQGQLEAITSAVLGRDVVVRMTTGQGKSSLLPRPFLGPGCSATGEKGSGTVPPLSHLKPLLL